MLTIEPVLTRGTLEGVDIICGTKGSICSANRPDGVPVELHPTADPGFTFMGFVGDCVPLGHTQMTVPRTCSATFSPTAEVSMPLPIKASHATLARQTPTGAAAAPAAPVRRPRLRRACRAAADDARQAAGDCRPVDRGRPETGGVRRRPTRSSRKARSREHGRPTAMRRKRSTRRAIQRLYPKVNMEALKVQLNASKYRSVQCKFGDPVFALVYAPGGKAKVQAPLKRVYEHTILTEKPQTDELIATITLVLAGPPKPLAD